MRALRADGLKVEVIDCGGGLGIPYRGEPAPLPAALAGAIRGALHNLDVRIVLEPGRWLVGPAGVLLASVILAKQTQGSRFIVLDAAMNDLIRPAMYEAWHGIVPVSAVDAVRPVAPADVVGPVCESGDTFARDRMLPPLAAGARVAILDAGAYGSVMSSAYNARPVAAEVMVDGSNWSVIRERESHADLWRGETRATLAEMKAPGGDLDRLLRRLAGRRALARSAILFERIWPALWPALGVTGLFVCAALLDLPRLLPPWWHIGLLAVTAVLIVGLLVRGLRGIAAPDDKAADRRLELASGLPHRPLAVLTDRPSRGARGPDTASVALWQAHVARAVRSVRRLRVGKPQPGLARLDPRALRAALVVALVAAVAIAGEDAPSRLAQAMEPTLPREIPPPATELQAWITPPAYTRLAPIFLKPDSGTVSVPAGARLTVSVTGGGSGAPTLALDGHSEPFRALDKASYQADRDLNEGGHLTVRRDGHELAAWNLAVVADQPPTAEWSDNPARAPGSQQTRLPWRASDDYGVVSLQTEMLLRDRRDAPPLVVSLPLPGGTPKSAHGVSQQDLTAHPWAGLPVIAKLVARDALNQTGESREVEFVLPQRQFQNPVAQALMAIRRDLSLRPKDRSSAVNGLDALLKTPEALKGDYGA